MPREVRKWTGWELNRRLHNRSPISTRLPDRLSVVDRSPVSYFEDENTQETLLNVEDYAIVPDSKPVIRGAHEPLDQSMGIVSEFSDLVEDPAGDRSIELPQLANGRLGPDDLVCRLLLEKKKTATEIRRGTPGNHARHDTHTNI